MKKIFFAVTLILFLPLYVWYTHYFKTQSQIAESKKQPLNIIQKEECRYYTEKNVVLPPELSGEKVSTIRDTVIVEEVDPEMLICSSQYATIGRIYNDYDGYVNGKPLKEVFVSKNKKFINVRSGSVFRIVGAFTLHDSKGTFETGPSTALYFLLEDENGGKAITGGYYVGTKTELPENYWQSFILQDSLELVKN
jgi:hypothetical protein